MVYLVIFLIVCLHQALVVLGVSNYQYTQNYTQFPEDCRDFFKLFTTSAVDRALTLFPGANIGHAAKMFNRLEINKKLNKTSTFLFSGSSVTQRGYFADFIQRLTADGYRINAINRGLGSVDLIYNVFCLNLEAKPDFVFTEMRFQDTTYEPKYRETLLRKFLKMKNEHGEYPLVTIVNFGLDRDLTAVIPPNYYDLALHYGIQIIDFVYETSRCFPKSKGLFKLYSRDYVHPTTEVSLMFITDILYYWFTIDMRQRIKFHQQYRDDKHLSKHLPLLYPHNSLNGSNQCHTLNKDAYYSLIPIESPIGFVNKTRTQPGVRGFYSIKRAWEGFNPGDQIKFQFSGDHLFASIYKHPHNMGLLDVYLDNEPTPRMHINSTEEFLGFAPGIGQNILLPVFSGLAGGHNALHNVTFVIRNETGSPTYPGYHNQIIALLYSGNE